MEPGDVYLVNFPNKSGNEFYGKHYAVILSKTSRDDHTLLVAPITGKKPKRKYRGGVTLNNNKYQEAPSYEKSYIYARKIQEIDKRKIIFTKKKQRDEFQNIKTDKQGKELFIKDYKKIYSLDSTDYAKLKEKIKEILNLNSDNPDNVSSYD